MATDKYTERRRRITDLRADPDPEFRPCGALLRDVEGFDELDRPVVPLLNALYDVGLGTDTSCAGHPGEDHEIPMLVTLTGIDARAVAALDVLAAEFSSPTTGYYRLIPVRLDGLPGDHRSASLYWGFNQRDRTPQEMAVFDAAVLRAARALEASADLRAIRGESHIERLLQSLVDSAPELIRRRAPGGTWRHDAEERLADLAIEPLLQARIHDHARGPLCRCVNRQIPYIIEIIAVDPAGRSRGPVLGHLWQWGAGAACLAELDQQVVEFVGS